MICIRCLSLFLFLFILFLSNGRGQAILDERVWTNEDGKRIRAELLKFGKEADKGLVRLRVKGGSVYTLAPETLSREDQAVILKARFEHLFRTRFNEGMAAHFFYSKKVPRDSEGKKTVAYIGNDFEGSWMRIKVYLPSEIASKGVSLMFIAKGTEPLSLPYGEEDINRGRSYSTIDLSLTKHANEVAKLFNEPGSVKIVIKSSDGIYTQVKLSSSEAAGLKEVAQAFRSLASLTTDHVWWSVFQGLDPTEIAKLQDEKKMEAPLVENQPEPSGPVLPLQEWTLEKSGKSFLAEVIGFDRHRVIFKPDGGPLRSEPLESLSPQDRSVLAERRLELELYQSWHPYDDEYTWYWPKNWTDPGERIRKQALLFAINRETGAPRLFLQQRFDTDSAVSISSSKLKSPKVSLDLDIHGGTAMQLRSQENTVIWLPLSEDYASLLLIASAALESLEYDLAPASGSHQVGEFTGEEFEASVEAIEIYRAWHSLITPSKPDVLNPFDE